MEHLLIMKNMQINPPRRVISDPLVQLVWKMIEDSKCWQDVEKRKQFFLTLLLMMQKVSPAVLEIASGPPRQTKNGAVLWLNVIANSLPRASDVSLPTRCWPLLSSSLLCYTVYGMEAVSVSVNRWIDSSKSPGQEGKELSLNCDIESTGASQLSGSRHPVQKEEMHGLSSSGRWHFVISFF